MSDETKTCPYCAETIKVAAVVCRFCQRDLPKVEDPISVLRKPLPQSMVSLPNKIDDRPGVVWAGIILFCIVGIGSCVNSQSKSSAISASPSPTINLMPAISEFLKEHEGFGIPTSTTTMPDWARGTRQRVQFNDGRDYLFYEERGRVTGVYQDTEGGRQKIWGEGSEL